MTAANRFRSTIAAFATTTALAALTLTLAGPTIIWPDAEITAGIVSDASNSTAATVTAAPDASPQPPASSPAPSEASIATSPASKEPIDPRPTFDVLRVDTNGEAVIAGRAVPGAILDLHVDGRGVAKAKADRLGAFEMSPPPLAAGAHRLELVATSDAAPPALSAPVDIDVPKAASSAQELSSAPLVDLTPTATIPATSSDSKLAATSETVPLSALPPEADRLGEPEAIAPIANLGKTRLLLRTAHSERSAKHQKIPQPSEPIMSTARLDRPRGANSANR
jgi:hypothetical protein